MSSKKQTGLASRIHFGQWGNFLGEQNFIREQWSKYTNALEFLPCSVGDYWGICFPDWSIRQARSVRL